MCHNVFNVWPKTTLLLPVWARDNKRLDTLIPLSSALLMFWTFGNQERKNAAFILETIGPGSFWLMPQSLLRIDLVC